MKSKKFSIWIGMVAVCLVLAACATQPTASTGSVPGILLGFVHGMISPFALVGELFVHFADMFGFHEPFPRFRVYAYPNTGVWYDFGFVLGVIGLSGLTNRGVRK